MFLGKWREARASWHFRRDGKFQWLRVPGRTGSNIEGFRLLFLLGRDCTAIQELIVVGVEVSRWNVSRRRYQDWGPDELYTEFIREGDKKGHHWWFLRQNLLVSRVSSTIGRILPSYRWGKHCNHETGVTTKCKEACRVLRAFSIQSAGRIQFVTSCP